MSHTTSLVARIREVKPVDKSMNSLGDLFENIYSGLDDLIKFNKRLVLDNKFRKTIIQKYDETVIQETRVGKTDKWKGYLDNLSWQVLVITDDAKSMKFNVRPRTNFYRSLLKRPNILHLEDEQEHHIVLREARTNPLDKLLIKRLNSHFDGKLDKKATQELIEGKIPTQKTGAIYIPEPRLINALELLYNSTNYPRFTPHLKIVKNQKQETSWYARAFLPLLLDKEFDLEKMGSYLARLHTIGLMEDCDRQLVHYALSQGSIVNYDPDFITHSSDSSLIERCDFHKMMDYMSDTCRNEEPNLSLGKDFRKEIRKHFENEKSTLNYRGFTPQSFLDCLNESAEVTSAQNTSLQ